MALTKPNQDLKRDLQGIASDAQAVLKMCTVFHAGEDRLAGYADEVKAGRILRDAYRDLYPGTRSARMECSKAIGQQIHRK